jgi:hypothetical protein
MNNSEEQVNPPQGPLDLLLLRVSRLVLSRHAISQRMQQMSREALPAQQGFRLTGVADLICRGMVMEA